LGWGWAWSWGVDVGGSGLWAVGDGQEGGVMEKPEVKSPWRRAWKKNNSRESEETTNT